MLPKIYNSCQQSSPLFTFCCTTKRLSDQSGWMTESLRTHGASKAGCRGIRLLCAVISLASLLSAATQREVAEWAIRQGGRVTLDRSKTALDDVLQLPSGPFEITVLDLTGTIIDPGDLKIVSGITSLRAIFLPGGSWTPGSDSPLDANDQLKYLAPLKNLERLSFSLHFLPTYNVNDTGIARLSTLAQLRDLSLAQSRVEKPSLRPFLHLRSLDLNDSMFTDDGMKTLEGSRELKRLYLRNTPVTDKGLKCLSELTQLEELNLYGTKVTNEGLVSLRRLTAMRKLNLLGADIDDAGVDVLRGMPHLEELNLYRSHITNSGLAKLTALHELKTLDVRYSRVTQNGVNELMAAIPSARVEFVSTSATSVGKLGNLTPSGPGVEPIVNWVRVLGGKTELTGGQVRSVSLARSSVSDRQLSSLSSLTGLKALDLSGTQVGDQGLAALKALDDLEVLVLDNTTVSDSGLEQLTNLRRLQTLRLAGTLVHGSGIKSLKGLNSLTELDLD